MCAQKHILVFGIQSYWLPKKDCCMELVIITNYESNIFSLHLNS